MQKLGWMIGRWEGSGWIDMGREGRRAFSYTQSVQTKQNGLVLALDGVGKAKEDASTIYSVFRLLSYPARDVTFKWHEFSAQEGIERSNEAHGNGRMLQVGFPPLREEEARVGAGTFRSDLLISNEGWVRFTISVNDDNEWVEAGEMRRISDDGETWFKFLQIVLHRKTK